MPSIELDPRRPSQKTRHIIFFRALASPWSASGLISSSLPGGGCFLLGVGWLLVNFLKIFDTHGCFCMASLDRLSRFKHYLDALFLLFVEDFIAVGSLSQRKPVSYDVIKSNAILLEPGDQLVDISVDQRLTGMDC